MRFRIKSIFIALMALSAVATGCEKDNKYLNVFPAAFDLDSDAQDVSAIVDASASWMIYGSSDWLTYSYGDNSFIIEIAEANESLEDRETEISVITGDGQTLTVPVIQRAMNAYFNLSPSSLGAFDADGKTTQTVDVSTNVSAWGFYNVEPWLTVVQGEGDDSGTLTLNVERSHELDPRRDTLVTGPSNELFYSLTDSIPIVQNGVALTIRTDYMNNSYVTEVPAEGAEVVVSVYAKESWEVTTDDTGNRLVFDLTEGEADTENGILMTITVPENRSAEPYTYILSFECGGEIYTYELTQAGVVDDSGGEDGEDGEEEDPDAGGMYRPKPFSRR